MAAMDTPPGTFILVLLFISAGLVVLFNTCIHFPGGDAKPNPVQGTLHHFSCASSA